MKNILTLFLLCLSAIVRSADLYVEENGASGAYTTIAAAVAASNAGDRILVFPRSGNASYAGFTYAGGSLQILSAVEGQRYRVNSDINFGALTGTVHISNMYIGSSAINTTAPCASPTITRLTDCYFESVTYTQNQDNHILYLQADTLISSPLNAWHFRLTGNYFEDSRINPGYNYYNSSAPANDTITMIGNYFNFISLSTYYYDIALVGYYNFDISNNYFRVNNANYSWLYCVGYSTGFARVNNNTIVLSANCGTGAGFNPPYCYLYTYNYGIMETKNNAVITAGPMQYAIIGYGSTDYNYTTSTDPNAIYPAGGTNVVGATLTYNANTGAITSAQGVNSGDPGIEFTDIDLTRNDVGCYGGSFTRANFDNTDNGSRVLLVNTPRRVVKGNPFTIKGDGLDK